MKKILRFIVIVSAALLLSGAASASGAAEVKADSVSVVPGHEIEYAVSVSNNPGFCGTKLRLRFDTSALQPVCTSGDESVVLCTAGKVFRSGTLVCALKSDGCQIFWSDTKDCTGDGELFRIRLRAAEDAAFGDYPVSVSYESANTINKNEERVPLSCTGGSVTVRAFSPNVMGSEVTASPGETFTYDISVQDDPGFASLDVQIVFDTTVLSLVSESGSYLTIPQNGFSSGTYNCKAYANAIEILWHSTENTTEEGTFISLKFRVMQAAPAGDYPIQLSYVPKNTLDREEQPVSFSCLQGSVHVVYGATVEILDSHNVKITPAQTSAQIFAAFYDKNGRMVCVAESTGGPFTVTDTKLDFRKLTCKVFWLNENHIPVSPCKIR